ncbi:ParB/RepB/Spo0J family partition protein [Dactylosporangium sucinum]|uniref:ParB-like N-terminal domain-containing protein n=1 Tax=Dactylosporangium sucinum TaxID=1424081 RepID=A0A917THG7_9ACTN|nr:ParB N-terminal domain-containing protein [Dactylosporangium sucinum]GGM22483.1 hypothetical protein GCM10007977_024550 [Dactylosporangium sucinum]
MSIETSNQLAQLVHPDPRELIVGVNVRRDARLTPDFVDSIRERGVLEPVVAYRDDEQRLVVLYGQRRTLGAVEAGRDSIPVMVVAKPEETDRIGDQLVENDHRAGVSTGDRVEAYQQMAAFGLTAAQIAKRTSRKNRDEVTTALTVANSPLAKGATERYDFLDLEQAAVVAEFEGDKEAVTQLIVSAKEGRGFDHLAQRLRDARADQTKRAAVEAELAATGLTVVDEPERSDPKVRSLHRLADAEGQPLDEDNHRECPGHAAYVGKDWHLVEITDQDDISEDEEDYDDEDDADDEETGGEQASRTREVYVWTAKYVCTDYPAHGHEDRYRSYDSGSQKKTAAEMTDEEREAARAARRDVIQSNKDWVSATTVRREWLVTSLLIRKTLPKGAAVFLAASLARPGLALTDGYALAFDLLKLEGPRPSWHQQTDAFTTLVAKSSEARAQVLALALVLAAFEQPLKEKSSWRNTSADTVRYLRFLEACGYDLAAIERRACGETPEPSEQDPAEAQDAEDTFDEEPLIAD